MVLRAGPHPLPIRSRPGERAHRSTGHRLGLELGGEALAGGNLPSQEIADIGAGLDAAHETFGTNPKGGHILTCPCRSLPGIAS